MANYQTNWLGKNISFTSAHSGGGDVPLWSAWLSSSILCLVSLVGLPLNGATVVIFWRRKKLRHLVNFVLLLDCLSHIILCFICIPIHLASVWVLLPGRRALSSSWSVLLVLQQVVGNFANLSGLLLTLSIAILRYRRLCWKKKDRFSTANAVKWSVTSGTIPTGFALLQTCSAFISQPHPLPTPLTLYAVKLVLIFFSILTIFFCYIRVAQRVWSSGPADEKVLDPKKLKKSRRVHRRATVHSCIQIILVVVTLCPYLYEETMETFLEDAGTLAQGSLDVTRSVGKVKSNFYHHQKYYYYQTTADRLWSLTINYILLILGTPLAYVASCHRFREQFLSLWFNRPGGHSPDDQQHPFQPPPRTGTAGKPAGEVTISQARHLSKSLRSHHHHPLEPDGEERLISCYYENNIRSLRTILACTPPALTRNKKMIHSYWPSLKPGRREMQSRALDNIYSCSRTNLINHMGTAKEPARLSLSNSSCSSSSSSSSSSASSQSGMIISAATVVGTTPPHLVNRLQVSPVRGSFLHHYILNRDLIQQLGQRV